MRIHTILVMGLLTTVCVCAAIFYVVPDQSVFTVVLTSKGYSPAELVVPVGATVVFKSERNEPFWPASNVHPTHSAFPDFDPRKPLSPEETWEFTFTKEGTYQFHDHIKPIYRGVVKVRSDSEVAGDSCEDATDTTVCLDEKVRNIAKEDGAIEALDFLKNVYESDAAVHSGCHGYTHSIGQEAYEGYSETGIVEITPFADYCGFGFYHGFMEAMLHVTGDAEGAKVFCAEVGKTLSDVSPNAAMACLHGIGHGVVDGSDPTTWGSPEKMIASALKLCEEIGDDYYEKKLCGTGVFNSLAILYFDPQYGLTINRDEPYLVCSQQTEEYFTEACHEDMNTLVWRISEDNFGTAAKYLKDISTHPFASTAMRSLALIPGTEANADAYAKDGEVCETLPLSLQKWCIEGYALGILEGGAIETKYMESFDFCDTPTLTNGNKSSCYESVVSFLKRIAGEEVYTEACQNAHARYKQVCTMSLEH